MGYRQVLEKKINLNKAASDIILKKNSSGVFKEEYKNLRTGITSCDFMDATNSRPFYILDEDIYKQGLRGLYTEYDKENDALLVVAASYKGRWKEDFRYVLYKEGGLLRLLGDAKNGEEYNIDICGESAVFKNKDGLCGYCSLKGAGGYPVWLKKQACLFFGAPLYIYLDFFTGVMQTEPGTAYNINLLADRVVRKGKEEIFLGMNRGGDVEELPPLPPVAYKRMELYAQAKLYIAVGMGDVYAQELDMEMACIQNCGGKPVIRFFKAYSFSLQPVEKAEIAFMETGRKILGELTPTSYSTDLVYADDLCGTGFEDLAFLIEGWTKKLACITSMGRMGNSDGPDERLRRIQKEFYDTYQFMPADMLFIMGLLGSSKRMRTVFLSDPGPSGYFAEIIAKRVTTFLSIEDIEMVEEKMGLANDGDTVDEILGVPDGGTAFLCKNNIAVFGHTTLDSFRKKGIDDVMRGAKLEDFCQFFKKMAKLCDDEFLLFATIERTLYVMVDLFGKKDLFAYFNKLSPMSYVDINSYETYLYACKETGMEWDVPEEEWRIYVAKGLIAQSLRKNRIKQDKTGTVGGFNGKHKWPEGKDK